MGVRLDVLSQDLGPLLGGLAGTQAADPLVLARGLALNGAPPGASGAQLVVREGPTAALGIATAERAPAFDIWLEATRRFLEALPTRLRFVTYEDVERLITQLAERLTETLGSDVLEEAAFVGIPRSGLIVLGMLSYTLGLRAEQLTLSEPDTRPVVVVDDCAYTGARVGEFLRDRPGTRDVTVALLLAPPPLLRALRQDDRVAHAVAGDLMRDLTDATTRPEWTSEWTAVLRHRPRYWVGVTDYVCFPWGETDWMYWNEVSGRAEYGWTVMPPEACLEHRPEIGRPALPVQVQPNGPGPLRPGRTVLFAAFDGVVLVSDAETGRRFVLEGVAADMWAALLSDGDIDSAAKSLLLRYDVEEDTLLSDLAEFVDQTAAAGILEKDAWHDQ